MPKKKRKVSNIQHQDEDVHHQDEDVQQQEVAQQAKKQRLSNLSEVKTTIKTNQTSHVLDQFSTPLKTANAKHQAHYDPAQENEELDVEDEDEEDKDDETPGLKLQMAVNSLQLYIEEDTLSPCFIGKQSTPSSEATRAVSNNKPYVAYKKRTIIAIDKLKAINDESCTLVPETAKQLFNYFCFQYEKGEPSCCQPRSIIPDRPHDAFPLLSLITSTDAAREFIKLEGQNKMVEATLQSLTFNPYLLSMNSKAFRELNMTADIMTKALPKNMLKSVWFYRKMLKGKIIPDFMWSNTVDDKKFVHVIFESKRTKCDSVYDHEDFVKICLSL